MDNYFIKLAIKQAKKALEKKEVPVGAVIVKDNKVIASGYNLKETKKNVLAHAEIICINRACKKLNSWRLEDCEMYITLEPCNMCLSAIEQARIKKVYYCSVDNKKQSHIDNEIFTYIPNEQCSNMIKNFFKDLRT